MVHVVYDDGDEEDWEVLTVAGAPLDEVVPTNPPVDFNIACYSLKNDKEFVSVSDHAPTPDRYLIVDTAKYPGITFFASLSRANTSQAHTVLVSGLPG